MGDIRGHLEGKLLFETCINLKYYLPLVGHFSHTKLMEYSWNFNSVMRFKVISGLNIKDGFNPPSLSPFDSDFYHLQFQQGSPIFCYVIFLNEIYKGEFLLPVDFSANLLFIQTERKGFLSCVVCFWLIIWFLKHFFLTLPF